MYADGVFRPLEEIRDAKQGIVYTVFSEDELKDARETLGWLAVAEKSFEFWNNEEDSVYDDGRDSRLDSGVLLVPTG